MTVMEHNYLLGHSEAEIRRLQTQAAILRPITERLLRCAGIQPGMRVLDLGSGAGDVAILAAEVVVPSGSVVGIDRNSQVLSIATQRALPGSSTSLFTKHRPTHSWTTLDSI